MKVSLRRDGIHVVYVTHDGDTIAIKHARFPRWPKLYGRTVAITPKALAEDPSRMTFAAVERVIRNAQQTDALLRKSGRRGLKWATLRLFFVAPDPGTVLSDGEPGTDRRNALISWKAASR